VTVGTGDVEAMADIIFALVVVAFFGLCVAYVRACDRLVRGDGDAPEASGGVETAEVAR